jgi:hypothetical protein
LLVWFSYFFTEIFRVTLVVVVDVFRLSTMIFLRHGLQCVHSHVHQEDFDFFFLLNCDMIIGLFFFAC